AKPAPSGDVDVRSGAGVAATEGDGTPAATCGAAAAGPGWSTGTANPGSAGARSPPAPTQAGAQRWPRTRTSAPPTENPPPENPCGFEAPNFWSRWTTRSVPVTACTDSLSAEAAMEGTRRMSAKPAWVRAAFTWSWAPGTALSPTTTP